MDAVAESLYIVALRDAPSSLPADAQDGRRGPLRPRTGARPGRPRAVAATLDAVLSLEARTSSPRPTAHLPSAGRRHRPRRVIARWRRSARWRKRTSTCAWPDGSARSGRYCRHGPGRHLAFAEPAACRFSAVPASSGWRASHSGSGPPGRAGSGASSWSAWCVRRCLGEGGCGCTGWRHGLRMALARYSSRLTAGACECAAADGIYP